VSLSDTTLARLAEMLDAPDLAGTKYELRGRVGRGGMGTVWRAFDRELGREVALKVLSGPEPRSGGEARLRTEAQVLARLEHPGLVPVHDLGTLPDGRLFYAMKLVRGRRLDEHVRDLRSPAARLGLFVRICDAVAFAHAHGVIHRDLKPQNVMVGPFGEVLVMDWGMAKLVASSSGERSLAGTPGYMAPEQLRGEPADARSDIYALGASMRVVIGSSAAKPLQAIVAKAMASDPDERYVSVEALAADVTRYRAGLPVEAYREGIAGRVVRVGRKYAVPIALVFAYLAMRLALLLLPR
jgi:eukaryotic-like serine/threonine-protein kinase